MLYEELFRRDVFFVLLKEPHINTETYKKAMTNQVALTGDKVDLILEGVTYETRKAKKSETMRQAGISWKSFYKYKREIWSEK